METKEEDLAVSRSSKSDTVFDMVIGHIEDIIMDGEFQNLQTSFMDKFYLEFEDTEENKLSYTDVHRQYTELIEKYISDQLTQRMPNFVMADFQRQLVDRKTELEGEVFEILLTFSDFLAFKEMMLDYRAEKEGRGFDLGSGFTVTSLGASMNGAGGLSLGPCSSGISTTPLGAGLCVSGSNLPASSGGNHVDLIDAEEAMIEGGNTPRLDCGEPAIGESSKASSNGAMKDEGNEVVDAPMEVPSQ